MDGSDLFNHSKAEWTFTHIIIIIIKIIIILIIIVITIMINMLQCAWCTLYGVMLITNSM